MPSADRFTLLLAIVVCLSLSALLMRTSTPLGGGSWQALVPAEITGFAVVQRVDEAYGLLRAGTLAELFGGQLFSQLETAGWKQEEIVSRLVDLDLKELGVVVHSLERRAADTYKLHFSIILVPGPGGPRPLLKGVEDLIESTLNFSADEDAEEMGVRVYRGREPRQLLYLSSPGQVLVISNGRNLLQEMEMARSGRLLRLTDRSTYRVITNHLPGRKGVFIYLDGRRLLGLFPEMGWRFWNEDGQIREAFYSASP